MTIEETISTFIRNENEKELLAYLQAAESTQRKELAPLIKKLSKHYNEFKNNGKGQYGYEGSDKQRDMLLIAGFVCLPKNEYEKNFYASWILDPQKFDKVKKWYCPDWFSDFVNKQASQEYISHWINYEYIMELTEQGYLQPSQTLIAKLLPGTIFEQSKVGSGNEWIYKPENLLKRPITLQEHIWYLFEEETNLHYSDRFLFFGNETKKETGGWIPSFLNFAATGRLDRIRLLRESLLATNKNFNKVLSGWFAELFVQLEPTNEELKLLQKELIMVLNAPHSKQVMVALQHLKKIAPDKDFDTAALIDALPVVLSSTTKNTVTQALMILEQTAKKKKEYRPEIARLCCQVFIHPVEEIQLRAAKIIAGYGDAADELLATGLSMYQEGLMQGARKELELLLQTESGAKQDIATGTENFHGDAGAAELQPIPGIDTLEDLLFLAAQAFDNNASWHIDILPAALINLQDSIKGPVLAQLQPALQRALQTIRSGLRSTTGYYDHMLAVFFVDVCVHLVRKHPADAGELVKLFDSFDQKDGDNIRKWMNIEPGNSYISDWTKYYKDPYYEPYKLLLTEALEKIRNNDTLPLLSTPTHQPAWIAPEVLVQRVTLYQQQSVLAMPMDAQIAIARCYTENTTEAIGLVKKMPGDEWQRLFLFLLQPDAVPEGPFTQPEAWMMASLSKWPKQHYPVLDELGYYEQGFEKYTGQLPWQALVEEYETDRYDYQLRKSIRVKENRKILKVDFLQTRKKETATGMKGLLEKLKLKHKTKIPPPLLYDYLSIKTDYFTNEYNDIRRALLIVPGNPEAFLPQLLWHCLKYPTYMGENDKKMVVAALQTLYELWDNYGDMAHLFLATCMLSADKTASGTAAEIWLHNAPGGKMKNELLGRIIGLQESIEFAPMKRFTDLVMQRLFRVSAAHNRMLQTVVEHILPELPDTPIKNLKKLLEIYAELLAMNNAIVSDSAIMERLQVWKGNAGLSKVAGKMIQED